MNAKNPRMYFEYVPKPKILRPDGRQYFFHAFWTFGQCIEAFKHCCDILSIDGTFLIEKYEGTLLIAIGFDADRQLVHLAFAIVEKENNGSWGWFIRLVQKVVVGLGCEICVISDRHARILNALREVIPNHTPVHHQWCTCHLAQNLIKHDDIKNNFKIFEEVCRQTDEKEFKKKLKNLNNRTNEKGKEFLKGLMVDKEKWSLAHDKGGKHYRYKTSNMAEIFNNLLRGVRSLPITTISSFTFYKCNEWFVKCLVDAQMVKRDHSDYVVAPNIYLDIQRNEARAWGMHSTCFDIQTRKYEVTEGGGTTSGGEHHGAKQFLVKLLENTCTCGSHSWFMFHVRTLLLYVIFSVEITTCPLYGQLHYVGSSGWDLVILFCIVLGWRVMGVIRWYYIRGWQSNDVEEDRS
jgi:predicted transcriptional regulator